MLYFHPFPFDYASQKPSRSHFIGSFLCVQLVRQARNQGFCGIDPSWRIVKYLFDLEDAFLFLIFNVY